MLDKETVQSMMTTEGRDVMLEILKILSQIEENTRPKV